MIFASASPEHQKKERRLAQEMRKSQWWRNQLGTRTCYHCEGRFELKQLTMDHLVPIARGGKTNKRNVVVSCKKCNSEKGNSLPIDAAFAEIES